MKFTDDQRKVLLKTAIEAIDEELITNKEGVVQETSKELLLECKSELEKLEASIARHEDVSKIARNSGMGRAIIDAFPLNTVVGTKILSALQACM
jgi:DNA-binding phage protein